MVKALEWESLQDRRKRDYACSINTEKIIDIDRKQYLTSNDSRTRGQHKFYQEKFEATKWEINQKPEFERHTIQWPKEQKENNDL